MSLTDAQIARYSRQIIVPSMGGRAQERILGSRLVILGALEDIEQPLAYLVGAGVGEIDLCAPGSGRELKSLCDRMRELNPDSTVTYGSIAQVPDLSLALIGSSAVLELSTAESSRLGPAVVARLDVPEKIAVLPSPPPCIRCASVDLLSSFGAKSDRAGFAAMVAATEAVKILAAFQSANLPSLIEFHGFETTSSAIAADARSPQCACSPRAKAHAT